MPRAPRTGKKHLEVLETTRKAMELRRAGATLQDIANTLGLKSRQHVHRLICNAMDEIEATCTQTAEQLRLAMEDRLDAIQLALWTQRKNPRVADTLLRIEQRRAALRGIDAPQKIAPTTPEGDALPPGPSMDALPTDLLRQVRDHLAGNKAQD